MNRLTLPKATFLFAITLSAALGATAFAAPGPDSDRAGDTISKAERQARREARKAARRAQSQPDHSAAAAAPGDAPAQAEIPYFPAKIESMQMASGQVLEGEIDDLRESDDEVMRFESGFGDQLMSLHLLEARFVARTDVAMPIALALSLDAHSTENGHVMLRLRNFETGRFEVVAQTAIGPSNLRFYIDEVSAARYVNPDGEMHLSLQQVVHVPILSHVFNTSIDLLEIGVY